MMETDDDVPLILTWDEASSGLLNEESERADESKRTFFFFGFKCPHEPRGVPACPRPAGPRPATGRSLLTLEVDLKLSRLSAG